MKRMLWLALACLLLASCSVLEPLLPELPEMLRPSAGELPEEPGEPAAPREGFAYGRDFLAAEEQLVYDRLCAAAEALDFSTRIPIPAGISDARTEQLVRYFWDDNPRYYWAAPVLTTTQPSGERTLRLDAGAEYTLELITAQREEIDRMTLELLETLPRDDYQFILALHDWLGANVTYNRYSQVRDSTTLYGSLINRSAVCDGYSKAFQYLLDRRGIPCVYLAGATDRGLPHSWNAVLLDGEWHCADVTWDSQEQVRHDYFLISREEMEREHLWDDAQYPAFPAGEATRDYYRRQGYTVDPGEAEELLDQFALAFARQMADAPQRTAEGAAFLEVKVLGSREEYLAAKEYFIGEIFSVLDRMPPLLEENGSSLRLSPVNEIACNYNDEMHVLTLFPAVEAG